MTTTATAGREAKSHTAVGVREMTRGWIMPGSMTITRTSDMRAFFCVILHFSGFSALSCEIIDVSLHRIKVRAWADAPAISAGW